MVPPQLLEAMAQALAAALIPPPRQPPDTDNAPDFLSRMTVMRIVRSGDRGGRDAARTLTSRPGGR